MKRHFEHVVEPALLTPEVLDVITSGCAMFMVVTTSAQSASADKAGNKAIAVGVTGVDLGVLGAALAKHHHHHGRDKRMKHLQVSNEENEIGQCMHSAYRARTNRGHSYVEFDHVASYRTSKYQDSITLRVDNDGRHSNQTKRCDMRFFRTVTSSVLTSETTDPVGVTLMV